MCFAGLLAEGPHRWPVKYCVLSLLGTALQQATADLFTSTADFLEEVKVHVLELTQWVEFLTTGHQKDCPAWVKKEIAERRVDANRVLAALRNQEDSRNGLVALDWAEEYLPFHLYSGDVLPVKAALVSVLTFKCFLCPLSLWVANIFRFFVSAEGRRDDH